MLAPSKIIFFIANPPLQTKIKLRLAIVVKNKIKVNKKRNQRVCPSVELCTKSKARSCRALQRMVANQRKKTVDCWIRNNETELYWKAARQLAGNGLYFIPMGSFDSTSNWHTKNHLLMNLITQAHVMKCLKW